MIFQLGKKGSADDEAIREETFKRWREASERSKGSQPGVGDVGIDTVELTPLHETSRGSSETQQPLPPVQESPEPQIQHFSVSSSAPHAATPSATGATSGVKVETATASISIIEEIKVDSMRAVEWPDPRSTVTLVRSVEEENLGSQRGAQHTSGSGVGSRTQGAHSPPDGSTIPRAAATPTRATSVPDSQPLRSATSKLAQFVTSGLSAAGLMGGSNPSSSGSAQKSQQNNRSAAVSAHDSSPLGSARAQAAGIQAAGLQTAGTHSTGAPVMGTQATTPSSVRVVPAPIGDGIAGASIDDDIKRRFGTNIRSALGPGTIIEGTFTFDTPVCIEGTLIGDIKSNSVLIVGAQASVKASVKVGTLVVLGNVLGDVEAEDLVEIRNGGTLDGDIRTERIAIEAGGWFSGRCIPTAPKKVLESRANNLQAQTLRGTHDVERDIDETALQGAPGARAATALGAKWSF